jgi:hypothetical protein
MQKSALLVLLFITTIKLHAQTIDTSKIIILPLLEFNEQRSIGGIETMPDTKENVIYAGKKLAVIRLDKLNADLSINNTRQVFGKVPGMTIWENDGSGIQAGIAARGLSPNRSWSLMCAKMAMIFPLKYLVIQKHILHHQWKHWKL